MMSSFGRLWRSRGKAKWSKGRRRGDRRGTRLWGLIVLLICSKFWHGWTTSCHRSQALSKQRNRLSKSWRGGWSTERTSSPSTQTATPIIISKTWRELSGTFTRSTTTTRNYSQSFANFSVEIRGNCPRSRNRSSQMIRSRRRKIRKSSRTRQHLRKQNWRIWTSRIFCRRWATSSIWIMMSCRYWLRTPSRVVRSAIRGSTLCTV